VLFLLPLFLQGLGGLSAFQSGLTTFPQAIGVMISSQIAGRLYHRVGPRRLICGGMIGVAIISGMFVFITLDTSLWTIRGLLFLRGACMAFGFVPLQAATYANVSPTDTGRASALYSCARQVAAALGVATLATIWLSRTNALTSGLVTASELTDARLAGFHDAFLAAAIIAVIGALSALLIRDSDAASTIRRPGSAASLARSEPGGERAVAAH
jgi:MFS family permease